MRRLVIDQGTTSTKAYVALGDGAPMLPVGTRTHRQFQPRPGWVEHDATELLANVRALIAEAGPVDVLGLANQGETVVAWDARTKRPLAPAIVWQDDRTRDVTDRLRAEGVEALTRERAGLPLDPYFSATKLRWLLDHADGAAALRREGRLHLGTSDAFFIDSLTGVFATDPSTASRTSLLDLRTLRWDAALCDAFGVPMECLPEIRPTVGDFGALPDGGPTLAASVVDQQASLFGHGCEGPGDIKITFGTGAFALGLTGTAPAMQRDSGLLPTVAWRIGATPAVYALDGGVLTAGAAVDWLRGVGLLDDAVLAVADAPSAAERGVFFVPAQAGLGCPHWDRGARATWLGVGLDTTREDLVRAVLEGVALRAAEVARAFAGEVGATPLRVSVDGGLSRSGYFTAFLAGALGQPIRVSASADLTAAGVLGLCAMTGGDEARRTARPATEWHTVAPGDVDFAPIHARFAEALARARGWAGSA